MHTSAAYVGVAMVAAAIANAQDWRSLDAAPRANYLACSGADPISGRALLFGGSMAVFPAVHESGFWRWSSTAWAAIDASPPPSRLGAAVALDRTRGRLVMFGGANSDPTNMRQDTWEWDGATWQQILTASSPPPSWGHGLAFDESRGVTVAFGGRLLSTTWEYDGVDWTQVATAASPPYREWASMVFDTVRNRVLLWGGCRHPWFSPTVYMNDLWEFDGSNWVGVSTGLRPSARAHHMATWDRDRQRMVVFGGEFAFSFPALNDTWEWDGVVWHQITPANPPPPTTSATMAYDEARQRVVLTDSRQTWEWDGTAWSLASAVTWPQHREAYCFARDPIQDGALLFGGRGGNVTLNDFWRWDGGRWVELTVAVRPQPRTDFVMALDSIRRRVVLFGGSVPQQFVNDTWEWDGAAWLQRSPAQRPTVRATAAMAFDEARGHMVLHGGSGGFIGALGDTHLWNGTNWTQVAGVGPSARVSHAMTWDPMSQRVILYGGQVTTDLWEWNGTSWSQGVAPPGPGRFAPVLFNDRQRGRTVLAGGRVGLTFGTTMEWDGVQWTNYPAMLPSWAAHSAVWDDTAQRIVVFDGAAMRTWTVNPAVASPYGVACTGSGSLPALSAATRPFLDNRDFAMWVDGAPPASPCFAFAALAAGMQPIAGGCNVLLAQPEFLGWAVTDAGGGALVAFPLPRDPQLVGIAVYAQVFGWASGGPAFGVVWPSNGLRLVLGY